MNTHDEIELPPLPAGYAPEVAAAMRNYARAAIEADREQRGEPEISTEHGPWLGSKYKETEGEKYCERCLCLEKFSHSKSCNPHLVYTAPQPADPAPDFPLGAIENGRAFADRLETGYSFECQGGPLRNCSDWQEFRRCFEYLAKWVAGRAPQPAEPVKALSDFPLGAIESEDHLLLPETEEQAKEFLTLALKYVRLAGFHKVELDGSPSSPAWSSITLCHKDSEFLCELTRRCTED